MRILFLSDNFPPESNAAASRVFERGRHWVKWGHQLTVVTCAPNFPEGRLFDGYRNRLRQTETMEGIRVVRVKTFIAANSGFLLRTLDFVSFMAAAVLAGLFERRPDVVVATSPQFFAGLGGWLLAALLRVPFVLELSDLWPASIEAVGAMRKGLLIRMLERLELFLYGRAQRIVALTNSFRQDLVRRGVPESKIDVVINGVELAQYEPLPRNRQLAAELGLDGCFVIGYIGTHGMAHALENVLDAAERVRGTRVRYLFVGAGAERDRLIAEAQRRKLDNVVFVPRQTKDRIAQYWSLCDAALVHLKNSPVFETVIPSKIFEAWAMGLPVLLAAPAGEASRLVLGESAGRWVAAEQPQELADASLELQRDAQLRGRLRNFALEAAGRYSRTRQAEDMLASLSAATGRPAELQTETARNAA